MMPAGGAAIWSVAYSAFYSKAAEKTRSSVLLGSGFSLGVQDAELGEGECRGYACYGYWAWGCSISVAVAIVLWLFAWRTWRRRRVMV